MRILTAFTNSLGGRDSYHLGVSLAEAFSCPLDLVTVVKGGEGRYVLDVTDHAFVGVDRHLRLFLLRRCSERTHAAQQGG